MTLKVTDNQYVGYLSDSWASGYYYHVLFYIVQLFAIGHC